MNIQQDAQFRSLATVLDLPVDRVTMDEALARITSFISGEGEHVVVTADASGLVIATNDVDFATIIKGADLVTPDSYGVVWAARFMGYPVPERVSGVDLMAGLVEKGAHEGYRIFLLGAAPGIAEMAADRLRLKFPGCNIVGTRHGFFPAESDAIVAAEIAEAKPDILFVAMGIPRQEKFIWANRSIIRAKVSIGVGGSFDVFSGTVKRAPIWVQRIKMEWFWRTLLNPKKIGKAKNLPRFVWRVVSSKKK